MGQGATAVLGTIVRAPMMRLAIPFVLGIGLAMRIEVGLLEASILLLASLIPVFVILLTRSSYGGRWRRGPIVAVWFFFFGFFWQTACDPLRQPLHFSHQPNGELWVMRLNAINGISESVVRADATVQSVANDKSLIACSGKVMLTLMRQQAGTDPRPGDELLVHTRMESITRIPDPGGFDRREWAASRGMYHECFAGPEKWVVTGHGWRWTDLFESPRQRVSAWLVESGLPLRERAMVKALVLGMRDELDGGQREAFVRSGTIHILAVSGTHVGFIYLMLLFMFQWWGGGPKARITRGILILLALWCYAGLTGGSPSVLRATIMFTLFTIAGMSAQRADPLNSLSIAAFVLLLWDPHMLIEIGFQLSFLAVLGIILFHGPLERLWVPDNIWVGRIWTLSVMSVSAQLLTTPLTLYLFKAFPIYFLPANLFVVTAAGFAVYGAVGMLVVFRIPLLGPLVAFFLMVLLMAVGHVTDFFANLPGAYPAIRIGIPDVLLLYVIVLSIAVAFMHAWRPAKHLALIAILCFLFGWASRARSIHDRQSFVVYDDRHALQATMSVGRSLVVLTGDDMNDQASWTRKKLDRHQRSVGSEDPMTASFASLSRAEVTQAGPTMMGGGCWSTGHIDVRFFTEGDHIDLVDQYPVDVLVIYNMRYLDEEVLESLALHAEQVVLAGEMAWKARAFAKEWCAEHALPLHDVRDQGAFLFAKDQVDRADNGKVSFNLTPFSVRSTVAHWFTGSCSKNRTRSPSAARSKKAAFSVIVNSGRVS